jgi:threonine dehydratase
VFVPVGGGGLIAGIAGFLKAVAPEIRVIGVEPYEADAMYRSLAGGQRVALEQVGIFADGVAVRQVGKHTFPIVQEAVEEVVRVTNDEICAAIKDVFDDTRSICEPAGALAVAGMKALAAREGASSDNAPWVAVISGANMNFDSLRFVAERAEIGEARESVFAVTIPEIPGSFRAFCGALGRRVITEFNYRLNDREKARVFVGVSTSGRADAVALAAELNAAGYQTLDLSDDEMAKLHVRHMVGGRAPSVRDERVFRFEFPERPGALWQFLDTLGGHWNISLFHYRNHGSDAGRVLAGIEVPDADLPAFQEFLDQLGYRYVEETGNPAYRLFLS